MTENDCLDCLYLPKSLYEKIENDVSRLFVSLNICSFPIDPVMIAEKLGYELRPFEKMNNEAKNSLRIKRQTE